MIRPRYLAVVPGGGLASEGQRSRFREIVSSTERMEMVADRPHLLLASQAIGPALASGSSGMILGSIFCRGRRGRLEELTRDAQTLVANSRGEHLVSAYWGGYIAFLFSDGDSRIDIVRGPFGDLPCYYRSADNAVVIASDVALLNGYGSATRRIDRMALARYLLAEDLRRGETCLSGVAELRGGTRLTIEDGTAEAKPLWSPWTFADTAKQITDAEEAASRVRDAVRHCVGAQATQADQVVLRLSGGLDSSIVAAALAEEKKPFTCLNLVTHNPSGDERRYAEKVASTLGAPIQIRLRRLDRIDIKHSDAARLPRPAARIFAQETRRLTEEVAAECGSDVAFDGGGGDNVFCSLKSARPVVDCMMSDAGRRYLWPTVKSVALLAQVSAIKVLRRAAFAGWRRSPAFRYRADARFLAADVVSQSDAAIAHPWLDAPSGALPGKAAQISLVVAAQSVVEDFDPLSRLPLFSPLISQPVIETCLRVPTWLWFDGGMNRATARRAFSATLPPEIIRRSSKGTPDSFLIEIYEANLPAIREMLLGGFLSEAGLVDRPLLERALANSGPVTGHDYFRLMRLLDAEAWARVT